MDKRIEVNVVAYQDGDVWVAQCVEYDIAAFAKKLTDLPRAFERAVAANVCANADIGREGLDGIPASPPKFRDWFEQGELQIKPTHPVVKPRTPVRVRDVRLAQAA